MHDHHRLLDDRRLALPPDHAFRYMTSEPMPELPEGLEERVPILTAAEIQAERLARKRSQS